MEFQSVGFGRAVRVARRVKLAAGALAAVVALVGCTAEVPEGSAGTGAAAVSGAGAGGISGMGGTATGTVPCAVQSIVQMHCQNCHSATPIGGAPMPLVTLSDFQQTYMPRSTPQLVGQSMTMAQLANIRINQQLGTAPMPQGAPLAAADLTTLSNWLAGGAPAGAACAPVGGAGGVGAIGGSAGMTVLPTAGVGGAGAGGGVGGEAGVAGTVAGAGSGGEGGMGGNTSLCNEEAYVPLAARPGETCYEFLTHNLSSASDTTKFEIGLNESYSQLYYAVPWPAGVVATRFGADFDNLGVLHHWLGFETDEAQQPGAVVKNVSGTTLFTNSKLFGGWASGGCNVEFPEDMGLQLPAPNKKVMIQWHHYNFTGTPQLDGSKIQICTVPQADRTNIGGLTWLGTENFNGLLGMPAGVESKFSGTCLNETAAPITIVAFWPHMHKIGINMYSEVIRAGGIVEPVFDKPFQNDHQIHYDADPYVVLAPGDKIRAECTFFNSTAANVAFGQSTDAEMCYQFAFSYPAGALDKPSNLSLIGATNTCWGD